MSLQLHQTRRDGREVVVVAVCERMRTLDGGDGGDVIRRNEKNGFGLVFISPILLADYVLLSRGPCSNQSNAC